MSNKICNIRPSSMSAFKCGSICEHLLFVQYDIEQKQQKVCGFDHMFSRSFKFYKNQKLSGTNFCNFQHP